jgi:hypothetical protein
MVEGLRERIDEAAKKFERAKKSLLRPDGLMKFSPSETNELTAVAEGQFRTQLDNIESEIEERIAAAEQQLLQLEHSDPSSQLDQAELEQAGARREFIRDEVFGRTAEGLAQRVRAIITEGDGVAQFLYLHYLRAKTSEAGGEDLIPDAEQLRQKELADELAQALDPESGARIQRAKDEIAELEKLKTFVYARRHGARDLVEVHLAQQYGSAANR